MKFLVSVVSLKESGLSIDLEVRLNYVKYGEPDLKTVQKVKACRKEG